MDLPDTIGLENFVSNRLVALLTELSSKSHISLHDWLVKMLDESIDVNQKLTLLLPRIESSTISLSIVSDRVNDTEPTTTNGDEPKDNAPWHQSLKRNHCIGGNCKVGEAYEEVALSRLEPPQILGPPKSMLIVHVLKYFIYCAVFLVVIL